MNRLWILGNFVTIILATTVLTPAFAQTDASKGMTKEESLSPGEEPGTTKTSTTETTAIPRPPRISAVCCGLTPTVTSTQTRK